MARRDDRLPADYYRQPSGQAHDRYIPVSDAT
jgi:hypothetical protein